MNSKECGGQAVVKKRTVIVSVEEVSIWSKTNFSELSKTNITSPKFCLSRKHLQEKLQMEISVFHVVFDMAMVEEAVKKINMYIHNK
jgi:hypothetical protein